QRLEKVSAGDPEDADIPARGGVNHFSRGKPREIGKRETPALFKTFLLLSVDRRDASDFRSALNAGVPADRHHAYPLTTQPAARQRDIEQCFDRLHTVRMLGQAH